MITNQRWQRLFALGCTGLFASLQAALAPLPAQSQSDPPLDPWQYPQPPYPPVMPARWQSATRADFADGSAACQDMSAFRGKKLTKIEPWYYDGGDRWDAGANCHLENFVLPFEPVFAQCPTTIVYGSYRYTGGLNGVCLSPIHQQQSPIAGLVGLWQGGDPNDPYRIAIFWNSVTQQFEGVLALGNSQTDAAGLAVGDFVWTAIPNPNGTAGDLQESFRANLDTWQNGNANVTGESLRSDGAGTTLTRVNTAVLPDSALASTAQPITFDPPLDIPPDTTNSGQTVTDTPLSGTVISPQAQVPLAPVAARGLAAALTAIGALIAAVNPPQIPTISPSEEPADTATDPAAGELPNEGERADTSTPTAPTPTPTPTPTTPTTIPNPPELDAVLANAVKSPNQTKGVENWDKSGGFNQANADFDSMGLSDVRQVKADGTRLGELKDGRTVNVRPTSSKLSKGLPTLEVQNGDGTKIAVRYNP